MDKTVLIEGREVFYRVYGEGKPVILIHGFGETGEVWNNQITFLEKICRLIIPDLPGSGRSAMTDDMSIEGMSEIIHSIIHQEQIDRCIVIGHSMGGYITLALAEKYWNHLNAFGLFHSTAFADSEEKKAIRIKGIEFMQQHGGFEFLKTSTPNLFSPFTKEQNPELVSNFITGLNNFSTPALVSYYKAMMMRPERTGLLKNNSLPVLFVMGKYDNAVPMADTLKQIHLPAKSFIEILKHSGHMGMLEEAEKSNLILMNFIMNHGNSSQD